MVTFLGGNVNQILHPYQWVFKCDDKVRCLLFIKELKAHLEKKKTKERVAEIKETLGKSGKTEEIVTKYNGIDYELQCAIKGVVKKVERTNFGYYRSPALTRAGKAVLIWKAIWSCRRRRVRLSRIITQHMDLIEQSEKEIARMSLQDIRKQLRVAVVTLKEVQRDSI